MNINITFNIVRNDEDVELEVMGEFDNGELVDWFVNPIVALASDEQIDIQYALVDAFENDFDEDKWQSERERDDE